MISYIILVQLDVQHKVYHVLVMKEIVVLLHLLLNLHAVVKKLKQTVPNLLVFKVFVYGMLLIIHVLFYKCVIKYLMLHFVEIGKINVNGMHNHHNANNWNAQCIQMNKHVLMSLINLLNTNYVDGIKH